MRRVITYLILSVIWCGAAIVIGGGTMKACVALAASAGGGIWFCLAAWDKEGSC
jgi:hypothetical protein